MIHALGFLVVVEFVVTKSIAKGGLKQYWFLSSCFFFLFVMSSKKNQADEDFNLWFLCSCKYNFSGSSYSLVDYTVDLKKMLGLIKFFFYKSVNV